MILRAVDGDGAALALDEAEVLAGFLVAWIADEGAPERLEDTVCPKGHEAVTCRIELPADEVQVLMKPAARVADRVTKEVVDSGLYWLVLLDRGGQELLRSTKKYSWEGVVALAGLFRGKDPDTAKKWWDRKRP